MTLAVPSGDRSRDAVGSRSRSRLAALWIHLALSLVLVGASVSLAGPREVFERLGGVDRNWLGAALALGAVQVALLGLRWSRIARDLGIELGWLRATTDYALSLPGDELLPTGVARNRLGRVGQTARLLFASRALVHLPLSFLLVVCGVLQLYVSARALGVVLPGLMLGWMGPLVLVAASAPGLFRGWGIREGTCALLFWAAGMSANAGVAVSFVYGVSGLVISIPAFWVLLFDRNAVEPNGETPWTYANAASMTFSSVLAAWIGYAPLFAFVAGSCCLIFVARGQGSWTPTGRFGTPNLITTTRLLITVGLLFVDVRRPGWHLAGAAGTILVLDAVDGWVARKTGQSSAFGAAYDVEADALLVTTIGILLFSRGTGGPWVLIAGLLRYLYVLAPALFPTPLGQAPRSRHGRIVYVTMLSCFMLALVVEGSSGRLLALLGTVVITASFSHSFWQRYAGVRAV